ncbi:unnamed protein product [Didymodactylos carnosus]|uniref:G-protein coupled receptors family 1 profile domain-containing protein n=1 Tax=Didymodactylos carnosus TaxID=1234261 RepID=A0A8S2E352_9BILA|nr:unnamed protein product [Didymodactylos carnosus]CAF3838535.1 unnamed protein product [Didymodactylos carnosus]
MNTNITSTTTIVNLVDQLDIIRQYIAIWFGLFLVIFGNIGNLLLITLFFSDTLLRVNPCSRYILSSSICDLVQLNSTLVIGILADGFNHDLTIRFSLCCKLRNYFDQLSSTTTLTFILLATIERYLLTSSKHHSCRLKHLLTKTRPISLVTVAIWSLISIPNLIEHSNTRQCQLTRSVTHAFIGLICLSFLPILLMFIFGVLTLNNLRKLGKHAQIIRAEQIYKRLLHIDKQLTILLLIQISIISLATLPFMTSYTYIIIFRHRFRSSSWRAWENLILLIIRFIHYLHNCIDFYIYMLVSSMFRHHFIKLMKRYYWYWSKGCCGRGNRRKRSLMRRHSNEEITKKCIFKQPISQKHSVLIIY